MDPVSALGLASSLIQIVDFSCKIFSHSRSIYSSSTGAIAEYDEVEFVADDLLRLTVKLQNSLEIAASSGTASPKQQPLLKLSQRCETMAEELLGALGRLKIKGKKTKFMTIRSALESIWHRDAIEEKLKRLSAIRDELNIEILFQLKEDFENFAPQVAGSFDSLERDTKSILYALLQQREAVTASFQEQFRLAMELQSKTTAEVKEENNKLRLTIQNMVENVSNTAPMYRQGALGRGGNDSIENKILSSLSFRAMKSRFEGIKALNTSKRVHQEAYGWLNLASMQNTSLEDSFAYWLRYGQGVFWITGKAGSGKSTLMKFLDSDSRTMELLHSWANGVPLLSATYYFWNSGEELQKSSVGLLRALLYEILDNRRELIPVVFPRRWFEYGCQLKLPDDNWTARELMDAFGLLLTQELLPAKFCFFIDGLDEFEGDYSSIVKLLRKIPENSNIKLCLSSRPLVSFEEAFGSGPKLMLQDFTYPDISRYVTYKFAENKHMLVLRSHRPRQSQELVEDIIRMASGVFLWVKLVVRSLLEGLKNSDSIEDLRSELNRLPTELKDLYQHMLRQVPAKYQLQAWKYLQIICHAQFTISPFLLSFANDPVDLFFGEAISRIGARERNFRVDGIDRQLKSRCLGLLEIRHQPAGTGVVTFLHRSVVEYLSDPKCGSFLVNPPSSSEIHLCLMRLALVNFKSYFQQPISSCIYFLEHASIYEHISNICPIDLMDEAARTYYVNVSKLLKPCGLNEPFYHMEAKDPFLALSVQSNVGLYTAMKLKNLPPALKKSKEQSRPLLFYAIIPLPEIEIEAQMTTSSFQSKPDVALTLLQFGADPNETYKENTPWYQALAYASASLNQRFQTDSAAQEDSFAREAKNWLQLFCHFIEYGADPFAFCQRPYIFDVDCERGNNQLPSLQILIQEFGKFDAEQARELEVLLRMKQTEKQQSIDESEKKQKAKGSSRFSWFGRPHRGLEDQ